MAYYIRNKSVVKICNTKEGIDVVLDRVKYYDGVEPIVQIPRENTVLIKTMCLSYNQETHQYEKSVKNLSNIVSIYEDVIIVNPFFHNSGKSVSYELYCFIENEVINLVRDKKIKELFKDE